MNVRFVVLVVALSLATSCAADATAYVDASTTCAADCDGSKMKPYRTLKEAAYMLEWGGLILLASGTYTGVYNVDLTMQSIALEIRSMSGSSVTIIDCAEVGRFIRANSSSLSITGITIKNCRGSSGTAAWLQASTTTFSDVVFSGNQATATGGAVYATSSAVTMTGCGFDTNSAGTHGDDIYVDSSSLVITDPVSSTSNFLFLRSTIYCVHSDVDITSSSTSILNVLIPSCKCSSCSLTYGLVGQIVQKLLCSAGVFLYTLL